MADKLKFYVVCPMCSGTGNIGQNDTPPSLIPCPRCANEEEPFGTKVFDGLRHVYAGRFEEVEDE